MSTKTGKWSELQSKKYYMSEEDEDEEEDDNLWYSAIASVLDDEPFIYVKEAIRYQEINHLHQFGELLVSEHYACQLKHGRALLRLGMNHPTTQIDHFEQGQLDSLHLLSCIEQACKSENVSQLARVLAQYESESKSAEERSSGRTTEVMTVTSVT